MKQDATTGEKSKSLQPAEDGKVTLANGDAPKTVELASIQQIMKPKPVVRIWSGKAISMRHWISSAPRTTPTITTSPSRPPRPMASGATTPRANTTASRRTDLTTTNNWDAEYSVDRFLTEKWFWDGRITYKRDTIEDLSRQRTVGTGPGYQFWDDELGAFKVGGLLNRTDFEYSNGEKDNFYSVSGTWDYNRYLIGKKVEFFTNGELGKPLSGVADYSLETEVGLRYKVTEWASLNLKAEKDIISGSDNGDLDKTRYTAGFGVSW